MEHIGIDLGARKSHLVVMSQDGDVLMRRKLATTELSAWLKTRPQSRVVLESCTQSLAISRASAGAAHETVVLPGTVVRALGIGRRGIKTDDRDAMVLAEASVRNRDLPGVHCRSVLSQNRRALVAARALLLKMRTQAALSIKSFLRGRLVVLSGRASTTLFANAVRDLAIQHEEGLPLEVDALLETYDQLGSQIEKLDGEIKAIAAADATCKQLMTVPGVGPIIALSFTAHIDEVSRFSNSEELSSYLALVPGESTTGGKIKRTSTIKAGPAYLKSLLVQGAWSAWRSRPNDPMVLWARQIAAKRGKRIAIIALARKLASVLYAMWMHGTTYDPLRASSVRMSDGPDASATSPSEMRSPTRTPGKMVPVSSPATTKQAKKARRNQPTTSRSND